MIWFAGDLHGDFRHLVSALKRGPPAALIVLGDIEATRSLELELDQVLALTEVWWIIGNHDTDQDLTYDSLFSSKLADKNLNGRVVEIDGQKVAGLGGVFREAVWMPPDTPLFISPKVLARTTPTRDRWRGGMERKHHSTIFPSTFEELAKHHTDILCCHEAPGCHMHGVEELAPTSPFTEASGAQPSYQKNRYLGSERCRVGRGSGSDVNKRRENGYHCLSGEDLRSLLKGAVMIYRNS